MKTGAWTACPDCRHLPKELEDRARHLITTDHYLKPDRLETISRDIQAGQKPQFVEKQVQAVMAELERLENDPVEKQRLQRLKFRARLGLFCLGSLAIVGIWLWLDKH